MKAWAPVIVLAALLAWWLWPRTIERPESPPVAESVVERPPEPAAAPVIVAPVPVPRATSGEPPRPPKGTISYRLVDGLLISYGDVMIGKPTSADVAEQGFVALPKTGRWPGKEIAYALHQDLQNPERVMAAIAYFNENTEVRFVPLKEGQADSIVFAPTNIPLCLSYVGRVGGHQPIYLDDRCSEREIVHEIMHALGFIHEHSRPDRDNYITVRWNNIEPDRHSQFEIAPEELSGPMKDRPFDYNSIMIYEDTLFGRVRGDITLESRTDQKVKPVEFGLSPEDLERLKRLYR